MQALKCTIPNYNSSRDIVAGMQSPANITAEKKRAVAVDHAYLHGKTRDSLQRPKGASM
jgi:hypothetical protein